MSRSSTDEERRVLQKYILHHYIEISLLMTKNINTKIIISPEWLMVINMQRTISAIILFLQSCESVVFTVLSPAHL